MHSRRKHFDKLLALLIAVFVVGGALIFASAAFGLLARGVSGITSAVFTHIVFGIGGGLIALFTAYSIDYRTWRKLAPYLYVAAICATLLVFIPHVGIEHGGGRRWVALFGFSFQPSEALKIGVIIMAAAYFASIGARIRQYAWGLGGFLLILLAPALILLAQPDLGTLGVIGISSLALYVAAGARMRDIAIVMCIAIIILGALTLTRPYVRDRVVTFFLPFQSQQEEGYQIKQSLIAIGSGGFIGRGFGQGVQKFTYLPEAMGDSIFAVAGEELGFAGASAIVVAYLLFALRGLALAGRAPEQFGALLAVGIATYLASEAFINIAAMVGAAPLTGIPLTFVSQGGSAMLIALGSAGILLNISRYRNARRGV
ncbi:MAG: putative lipid II flippase FtsW [Patescibacteria group bacterium]|nr:putative lipid II flippase FtsW [Patescibacteria group bacterium]